jgi:hypothetical protein
MQKSPLEKGKNFYAGSIGKAFRVNDETSFV